jgi:hypothetical protein
VMYVMYSRIRARGQSKIHAIEMKAMTHVAICQFMGDFVSCDVAVRFLVYRPTGAKVEVQS